MDIRLTKQKKKVKTTTRHPSMVVLMLFRVCLTRRYVIANFTCPRITQRGGYTRKNRATGGDRGLGVRKNLTTKQGVSRKHGLNLKRGPTKSRGGIEGRPIRNHALDLGNKRKIKKSQPYPGKKSTDQGKGGSTKFQGRRKMKPTTSQTMG